MYITLFFSLQSELTKQQNEFKIKLKELEDSLLSRLSAAGGNILGDTSLVENLETTKRTANEVGKKVAEAKVTEKKINEARENYRPAAARASLLYFIINNLEKINPLYQFSLKVQINQILLLQHVGYIHYVYVLLICSHSSQHACTIHTGVQCGVSECYSEGRSG